MTLLAAARAGDEEAFRRLVEPYLAELHAHCRRMLGSAHEAEDAMQEVLLRAWRALGRFEARASLRSWLYRIATNASLDAIEQRRRTAMPVDYEAADGACPLHGADQDDSERLERVEAALRTAVEDLPANQRAAVLMRGVLGFSASESAAALATTPASVNSALQRARAKLEQREPDRTQRSPEGDVVAALVAAISRDDVGTVLAIATDSEPAEDRAWTFSAVPAY